MIALMRTDDRHPASCFCLSTTLSLRVVLCGVSACPLALLFGRRFPRGGCSRLVKPNLLGLPCPETLPRPGLFFPLAFLLEVGSSCVKSSHRHRLFISPRRPAPQTSGARPALIYGHRTDNFDTSNSKTLPLHVVCMCVCALVVRCCVAVRLCATHPLTTEPLFLSCQPCSLLPANPTHGADLMHHVCRGCSIMMTPAAAFHLYLLRHRIDVHAVVHTPTAVLPLSLFCTASYYSAAFPPVPSLEPPDPCPPSTRLPLHSWPAALTHSACSHHYRHTPLHFPTDDCSTYYTTSCTHTACHHHDHDHDHPISSIITRSNSSSCDGTTHGLLITRSLFDREAQTPAHLTLSPLYFNPAAAV